MPRHRRPPAAASSSCDSDLSEDELGGSKRPPQRNAANERERARMRVLSKAFCRLKTTLPWVPADTKLSKLDTLRLATSYIAHLRAVLLDQPVASGGEGYRKHPLTLTWPFSFHRAETAHHQPTGPDELIWEQEGPGGPQPLPRPGAPMAAEHDMGYYY